MDMEEKLRELGAYTVWDWVFDKTVVFIAKVFLPIGLLWALGVNLWMWGFGRGNLYLLWALGAGILLNWAYDVIFGSLFRDLDKLAEQVKFERRIQEENAKLADDRERFRDIKDFVKRRIVQHVSKKMVSLPDKLSGKPIDPEEEGEGIDYKGGNARDEDGGDDFRPAA